MKQLTKTFLAGLAVGIPIIATIWVLVQAGLWINGLAIRGVGAISEPAGQAMAGVPGLGIATILALVLLLGLAARFWLTARLLRWLEFVLERVPLVKTVYTSVRDMLRFFGPDAATRGRVVLYRPGDGPVRMLAIVTNERPVGLTGPAGQGMVSIWLPMSYNLGGYMLYVPVESVQPIDMSVEQVMKLTATAELGAGPVGTATVQGPDLLDRGLDVARASRP